MVWVSQFAAVMLLLCLSLQDMKEQRVSRLLLVIFLMLGIISQVMLFPQKTAMSVFSAIWIWMICLLAGKICGGGIGRGDIWLLIALPFWKREKELVMTLVLCFALSAVYALAIFGIKNKKRRFPFIPWILIGFAATSVLELISKE